MISWKTLAKGTSNWFWGAVVLLLSAIVCHWISLRHNGQSFWLRRRVVELALIR